MTELIHLSYEVRKSCTFHKMSSHLQISKFTESKYHLGFSTTQRRKLFTFLPHKSVRQIVRFSPGQMSKSLENHQKPLLPLPDLILEGVKRLYFTPSETYDFLQLAQFYC